MDKRYHLDRQPIPEGWRIFEERLPVMGVALNKGASVPFCRGKHQSLALEPEPTNDVDNNAIMIVGHWPGWFREHREKIGYVPKEVAARLAEAKVAHAVGARLLMTYVSDEDFVEVLFQVIGPVELFQQYRAQHPAHRAKVQRATMDFRDAELDLLATIESGEKRSAREGLGVAPAPYLNLAKLYRKAKKRDEEISILERYDRQQKAPGRLPAELAERLRKLRES